MQIPIILNHKSTISRQKSEVPNCNGSATLFNTFLKQRLEDAESKRRKKYHEKIAHGAWLFTNSQLSVALHPSDHRSGCHNKRQLYRTT